MKKHVHTFKYMHSVWKSQKVAFNIASEASDVYTLSGQKSIKNGQFGKFLKPEASGQIVLPDSHLK